MNYFHVLPTKSLVENPYFSANPPLTWCHFLLCFDCKFLNIFKKIHNCQVNWVAYSFGGQMKANPNYFGAHGIFLALASTFWKVEYYGKNEKNIK
jgi:hypothetical protein